MFSGGYTDVTPGPAIGGISAPDEGGEGYPASEQGLRTVAVVFDHKAAERLNNEGRTKDPVYPAGKDTDFNISPMEFLMTPSYNGGYNDTSGGAPRVISSLNAEGAAAKQKFPKDVRMQTLEVLKGKKYAGVARDTIEFGKGSKRYNLACQIDGISSHRATVKMPFGYYALLRAPNPNISEHLDSLTTPSGVPLTKFTLEAIPYSPNTVMETLTTHLRNQLHDTATYKSGTDQRHRTTDSWLNFGETRFQSALMTSLLFLYRLVDNGILSIKFKKSDANNINNFNLGDAARDKEVILGLAQALELLPGTGDVNNVTVGAQQKKDYSDLRRDILDTIFYDGTVANNSVGWDKQHNKNPQILSNSKIMMNNPEGKMLYRQLNHYREEIAGTADALNRFREFIAGKIVGPSDKGGLWDLQP